jgi:hypothetical protein
MKATEKLSLVPLRVAEYKVLENGLVTIIKRRDTLLDKVICFLFRKPREFSFALDEIGSHTWLLSDGDRSINEISKELFEKFHISHQESENDFKQRVLFFYQQLKKISCIDFPPPI